MANSWEALQAGVTVDGGEIIALSEPTASIGAASMAAPGTEERSMGPEAMVPATMPNSPVQGAELIDSPSIHSQTSVPTQVLNVQCIEEPVRTSKNNMTTWKPPFEVEEGSEDSLKEIIQRADLVRAPWNATPLPTGSAHYGTTEQLFGCSKPFRGWRVLLNIQVLS